MHYSPTNVRLAGITFTILCLPLVAHSLRFHLQPNTKRCLKEEMRKDVLVTGEYELSDSPGIRTDLLVCFQNNILKCILF